MTGLLVWVPFCLAAAPGLHDPVIYPPEVFAGEAVAAGELRVDNDDPSGAHTTLVLEHSSIVAEINAGLARVTMMQWFHNPYDEPISATYLLPLPEKAAVDRMEMQCGDRVIDGIVLERAEARALYEDAKADGRKAALLEQERDNLFTQSISNLCPGEEIALTLQWVEPVGYEDGTYSWSMPLTVGPRFVPPWVEDGDRLVTPYDRDGQDVDLSVVIDEGMPVESLWSDTHDVTVDDEGSWGAEVVLTDEATLPNQDFTLNWTLAGKRPQAGLVVSRPDPDEPGWLALTIEPPELGPEFVARPRELVFLVDQSGSMQGEPYAAATAAVARALSGMRRQDTFNLVRFSDDAATLYPTSQPSNAGTRSAAAAWLEAYDGGGTQMEVGLAEALDHAPTPGAMRLVVLLTDGFVGQDDEVLALTKAHLGRSRIFSFGVSASPNRALLSQLADVGRGAVIYHQPGRPIDEAVARFQARIAHPAMTDLKVDWGGLKVTDLYPSRLPDLWAGQPLRLVARYEGDTDTTVHLTGVVGTSTVQFDFPVDVAPPDARHEAVITAWARAKIGDLVHRDWSASRIRSAALEVALEYGLVTRWTSLVAIDEQSSACGPATVDIQVPHLLPTGVADGFGPVGQQQDGVVAGKTVQLLGAASYGNGAGASGYSLAGGTFGSTARLGGNVSELGYAAGRGGLSAKAQGGITTVGGEPIILGSLDKSLVEAVIRRGLNQVRYCYQRELQKEPTLAGKVVVKFVIAADGSVPSSEVKSSTLGNTVVEQCVANRILRWTFPPAAGGGIQIVSYPFTFAPK